MAIANEKLRSKRVNKTQNSIKCMLFTQVKRRKYLLVHITTRHISINYVVRSAIRGLYVTWGDF